MEDDFGIYQQTTLIFFFFTTAREIFDLCDHRPPLYDWQTRTVWPKNIKIENTVEAKTPTS